MLKSLVLLAFAATLVMPQSIAALQIPDERPTMHILVIGVDGYGTGFQLHGAVNDARAFSDSLTRYADPVFDVRVRRLLNEAAAPEAVACSTSPGSACRWCWYRLRNDTG